LRGAACEDGPGCGGDGHGCDANGNLPATVENAQSKNDSARTGNQGNDGIGQNRQVSRPQGTSDERQASDEQGHRNGLKQSAAERLRTSDGEGCREPKDTINNGLNRNGAQQVSRCRAEPEGGLRKLHQTLRRQQRNGQHDECDQSQGQN